MAYAEIGSFEPKQADSATGTFRRKGRLAEPHSYITGALTAIVNGHKQKHIDQLLPWNFRA
jgi:hypothetical protein